MRIALLLSGGVGRRFRGAVPKQYLAVEGRMVLTHCLARLCRHPLVDGVQIVAAEAWRDQIRGEMPDRTKLRGFSLPGENRQLSICNGLADILRYAGAEDAVLIHDAARPLLSEAMVTACFDALEGHDGVLPVLPMTDTVYWSETGERADRLLDREKIYAGQAPEAFLLGKYWEANRRLDREALLQIRGSTEPAVLAGLDVVFIPGDPANFKITTAGDLERFREALNKEGKT